MNNCDNKKQNFLCEYCLDYPNCKVPTKEEYMKPHMNGNINKERL